MHRRLSVGGKIALKFHVNFSRRFLLCRELGMDICIFIWFFDT